MPTSRPLEFLISLAHVPLVDISEASLKYIGRGRGGKEGVRGWKERLRKGRESHPNPIEKRALYYGFGIHLMFVFDI